MKKLLLIIFLIVGCEEVLESIKEGCTTATACNYDVDAGKDDGSCVAPQGCNEWCVGDSLSAQEFDCVDVCGGTASIDSCGTCTGGTTNLEANYLQDCLGVCAGTAVLDDCGVCDGDGTSCEETVTVAGNYTATTGIYYNSSVCSGQGEDYLENRSLQLILNSDGSAALTITDGDYEGSSTATWTLTGNIFMITYDADHTETYIFTDNSLIFHQENLNTCLYLVFTKDDAITEGDCDGNVYDECGVCGGDGIPDGACNCSGDTELDCAGVCGGGAEENICGVCTSATMAYPVDYTGLVCCDGIVDGCGVCGGDNSPNTGTCDCAGTPNGTAVEDACGVCNGDGSTCNISYSTTIQPIFNNNCTGCHGGSGGLSLTSYSLLMENDVVNPGNSAESQLIKKLKGTAGTQMPKNQNPLDDATIDLIETWIDQGAQNN